MDAARSTPLQSPKLGLASGMGLVIANMMGVGVLISAGFLVQDMSPTLVMVAWVIGLWLALCGVLAYAGLATSVNRSGGEYRFLSEIFHPIFGIMAGWASLFVGFSAPIAISAIAFGAFGQTLGIDIDERILAAIALVVLLMVHSMTMKTSVHGQNFLVVLKVVLITSLVILGLCFGNWTLPDWNQPISDAKGSMISFIQSQYWIAFAFSGWNSAIYCIDEFRNPKRDAARAMFWGCLAVGMLYLLVNWVFVANITPEDGAVVFSYAEERVTLAHVLVDKIMGGHAGIAVSGLIMLALFSSMSAMTFVGPRVYSEMAKDGFLPPVFAGKEGHPPTVSVVLQTSIALLLVFTQSLLTILEACAAALMLFSVLCCIANLLIPVLRKDLETPSLLSRIAAAMYLFIAGAILIRGVQLSENMVALASLLAIILLASAIGYWVKNRRFPPRKNAA